MLNSNLDLDPNSRPVGRSISPKNRQIATESSIDSLSHRCFERALVLPIFAEATALAIRLTDSPIAILTTSAGAGYAIGSISGLERLTQLPRTADLHAELAGLEYCYAQTIGSSSDKFLVTNLQADLYLASSALHCKHEIKAYLGIPIITAARDLLGTLSILDFSQRQFSDRDIDSLQTIARLVASEFERKLLSQAQLDRWVGDLRYADLAVRGFDDFCATEHDLDPSNRPPAVAGTECDGVGDRSMRIDLPTENCSDYPQLQSEIQFKLLTHLAQELRTPLTAVLGMASVLQQEIYGSLSGKQKDYLGIIHHSGEQLVTIVNEISELGGFDLQQHKLTLRSVDLEMLCRLALQSLEPLIQKKHHQIVLDLVGGEIPSDYASERIWVLDKDKVRQIIYYLSLSLIHTTSPHHHISIRIANLTDGLQLQLVTSDELVILTDLQSLDRIATTDRERHHALEANIGQDLRIRLGLSLSQTLASAHGGKIEMLANGRGYQLNLPLIVADATSARLYASE
jgi:signal transduction histidine kinase